MSANLQKAGQTILMGFHLQAKAQDELKAQILGLMKSQYKLRLEDAMKGHFGGAFEVEFLPSDANSLVRFHCTKKNGDAPSHNQKQFIKVFGLGFSSAFDIISTLK